MVVLVVVAVVGFTGGVVAATRWLPELADTAAGTLALFVICALCGATVALIGINLDSMIHGLEGPGSHELNRLIVTNGLTSILRDGGTVAALALIALLLAPKAHGKPQTP